MKTALDLSATFEIKENQLVLTYEVANHDRRDAYLLNRLYKTVPKWQMTADVIYIHLDSNRETVWLSKKLADLPQGLNITSPVAPYVTPVQAGSSFREVVHIPLPVHEYRQYAASGPGATGEDEPDIVSYKHVYFSLGYYWRPEGTVEDTQTIQDTEVVLPRTPPGKPLEFGLLETERQRLDIPVLVSKVAVSKENEE